MFSYEREVRFHEVDAAGIMFFPTFLVIAHEAMEDLFAALDGGYRRLIVERRIGLPAVDVAMRFSAPLRFGDLVTIETATLRLGNRSATLRYRFNPTGSHSHCAEVEHTVVCTDLDQMSSCDMPGDVRAIFSSHHV